MVVIFFEMVYVSGDSRRPTASRNSYARVEADGSIVSIGSWISRHPNTIDKHDFMSSLRQYADYRQKFPRPEGLPPRSADVDVAIAKLPIDQNEQCDPPNGYPRHASCGSLLDR